MLRRFYWVILFLFLLSACRPAIPSIILGKFRPAARPEGPVDKTPQAILTLRSPAAITTALPDLTSTPAATLSPQVTPSATPEPTSTELPYLLQPGSPVFGANFLHPEAGCDWAGIAGQVFSKEGEPVPGLIVQVEGILNQKPIQASGVTGEATGFGPGGYEIVLSKEGVVSAGDLKAQLLGQDGQILSDPALFQISASCDSNTVLLNFTAYPQENPLTPVSLSQWLFFPIVYNPDKPGK